MFESDLLYAAHERNITARLILFVRSWHFNTSHYQKFCFSCLINQRWCHINQHVHVCIGLALSCIVSKKKAVLNLLKTWKILLPIFHLQLTFLCIRVSVTFCFKVILKSLQMKNKICKELTTAPIQYEKINFSMLKCNEFAFEFKGQCFLAIPNGYR